VAVEDGVIGAVDEVEGLAVSRFRLSGRPVVRA
jgi:hypothetical protein